MDTRNVHRTVRILSILAVATAVLHLPNAGRAQEGKGARQSVAELVRGVVARSEALFSGRIEFQSFGTRPPNKELLKTQDETFYFSGSRWCVLTAGSDNPYETCYGGKYIRHETATHPDGHIGHVARVSVEKPINHEGPKFPIYAGSFWEKNQRDYVKNHVREARDKGQVEINGVSTFMLEWSVPEADKYKAFGFASAVTERGGKLRIYIAPQLGYALPCVEIQGLDGTMDARYDAFDFFEAAPGIFIPKRCQWLNYYDREGNFRTTVDEIRKVEKVNEPIPDEVFKIYLPLGTRVADDRSGKGTQVFDIKAESDWSLHGLDDIVEVAPKQPFWRRRGVAITIGVAAGLLVVLAIVFFKRGRAKGSVPS